VPLSQAFLGSAHDLTAAGTFSFERSRRSRRHRPVQRGATQPPQAWPCHGGRHPTLPAWGAAEYAWEKRRLAIRFRDDRRGYTDAKGPFLWELIRRADAWAQAQGWAPGPSDA
jgi:hypothetical protein